MIGVVLWSDPVDRKAVFWCEDQGDLAFYDSQIDTEDGYGFFDAGDLVQFEVSMERRMRLAHNAQLVRQNACTDLPDRLMEGAGQSSDAPSGGAKIVPFTEALNRRPAQELVRREA